MYITGRFTRNDIERHTGEKNLQQLHMAINSIFKLPTDIREASDPVKELNDFISDQSTFTFSFVRHPYTR